MHFTETCIKFSLLIIFTTCLSYAVNAQNNSGTYLIDNKVINLSDKIDKNNVNEKALELILFDKINDVLKKRNKELFQLDKKLSKAAQDQAYYMAEVNNTSTIQPLREKATTALRVQMYGGSMRATEIVDKNSLSKGKISYSYGKVCEDIALRLFSNSKKEKLLESHEFYLIGIGVRVNQTGKRAYVSLVLGNFMTNNDGAAYKNNLQTPYSNKYYGLTALDPASCRKVNRMNGLHELQSNLTVENNTIYYETDNAKQLKKIIKKKKDALAIDILQADQFKCNTPNLIDYNNLNRGILLKRVYANKLWKKNIANTEDNRYALKTPLGQIPESLKDDYELNLVIIQNKSICKSIAPGFIIQTEGTYSQNIELLADTVTINSSFRYKPIADSMVLTFRIPFENKKYNYKSEDIEPFLKLLNEPEFIIYNLNITAYSSIEGTNKENEFLQEARAKSIINALKERQKEDIATEIKTAYNWEDFKRDVSTTKHNKMASMGMEEAQKQIREQKLKKELEPILQKHRYAEIRMKVTYDISGNNEQAYVLKQFNDAITESDRIKALSVQKYIIQQIIKNRYDIRALQNINIPHEYLYSGMEMNQLYMLYRFNQISSTEFAADVEKLYDLNPENEYIAFNHLLNTINNSSQEFLITENVLIQNNIDRLYFTPLKKSTIDGLNVKYQFQLINTNDSSQNNIKQKEASIQKIKEIVNIQEESMNNALKLAEIFIDNRDYNFARESLEPWIDRTQNEKVLYTYISLCSIDEWLMHSQKFTNAMLKASKINPDRYCDLFNGSNFSLRVLENKTIKENYCESCTDSENTAE